MIYLIGGVPRCGKTTVAKKLSRVLSIPWVPADYLASVVRAFIPKLDWPKKLPLRYIKHIKNKNDNDLFYNTHSAAQIMGLYMKQAKTTWKGIENFIEYAISEEQDYIIEGHQIQPAFLQKMKRNKLWSNIKVVFIYKEDTKKILEGIHLGDSIRDRELQHTKKEETLHKIAHWISAFGKKIKNDADKYHFRTFNMDGNFKEKTDGVVNYLKK